MNVTFLGTSHGVPEANRRCSCVLLTIAGARYVIDAGTPVMAALRSIQADVDSVKGVFLTHMHGDHSNGLIEFVDLCTWYFKSAKPLIHVPEIAARDAILNWMNLIHGRDCSEEMPEFRAVTPGAFYDDGVLRMTAIPNAHLSNRPSYSYLVEAEGKRLVFTGDLSADFADFPAAAFEKTCDLVVTEAAHCRLTSAVDIFRRVRTKQLYVSHIAPWNEPEVAKLRALVPYPVALARDNLTIEV
ncbi:MAG: MBL fold metallo-hydrolase [Christensenellales bacterium]